MTEVSVGCLPQGADRRPSQRLRAKLLGEGSALTLALRFPVMVAQVAATVRRGLAKANPKARVAIAVIASHPTRRQRLASSCPLGNTSRLGEGEVNVIAGQEGGCQSEPCNEHYPPVQVATRDR